MYRTSAQIDVGINTLAAAFPQSFRETLPNATHEGRAVQLLTLRAGDDNGRRGVLLVGGTHARELMNPDLLLELAAELLTSYTDATDIIYGGRTWPAATIRAILESLNVFIVCNSNPDGRERSLNVEALWRKNRRDNPSTSCDGVDLNRNMDLLWGVTEGVISCDPCADTYCGPSSVSEPESRNVRWVMDNRRLRCFVDVHSFSELVLYPWGHAPTQTTDPSKTFTTLPTGTCAPIGIRGYAEYMPAVDVQRFVRVSNKAVQAIAAVRGRNYLPQTGIGLYPTTGTNSDYAYARHIADPSTDKIYGFTFETGPSLGSAQASFQPADPEPIKTEAKSGLIAVLQQCICAIDLIGLRFFDRGRVDSGLRALRDEVLPRTEAGQRWVLLFEEHSAEVAEAVLADEGIGELAVTLLGEVELVMSDADAVVTEAHLELVAALIGRFEQRKPSRAFLRDLRTARARTKRVLGQSRDQIVEELLAMPPSEQRDG